MLTVNNIIDHLKQLAPLELAAEWDNVGLLLGDGAAPAAKIMTCLTVTPEVAAEAVARGVSLIVTHHPVLFRPVQRLTAGNAEGKMLLSLLQAGVAVYSPHTAFDNAAGGINELLAAKLGLKEVRPLVRREGRRNCKIVVFVTDDDLAKVSAALFAAGAGNIGEYSQCSYRLQGTGTFRGSDQSNPTLGTKGQREEVSEWRLEVVCPEERVTEAVRALRQAHSYEEPAFDVYPLKPGATDLGEGRLGKLEPVVALGEFARLVKSSLAAEQVQIVGDADRPVRRVAIVCGAGGSFLKEAAKARADVLLTGEARFHDYLAAQAAGVALILPGHYATERCGIEDLAGRLRQQFPALEIWPSEREADPARLL